MTCAEISNRFHDALSRAFASHSPEARLAYFDLADFYREQLGRRFQAQPSVEVLSQCFASHVQRQATGG
jgi:hypothetical protein